jgi:sugar/nucleoside kinase (ribokinase family)
MFDVVCIGNALIDIFLFVQDSNTHIRLDKKNGELCFRSGGKIPVGTSSFETGGNACNVAVGLARLGLHSALLAEIGNDVFTHQIKKQLETEHVSMTHLLINDSPSSFAIGINFGDDRILFTQHVQRRHIFDFSSLKTKWVYLTSLGEKWRHVYREIPGYIRSTSAKLAFNPGSRQIASGKDSLEVVLAVSDILFVNKEEAEAISNINPPAGGQMSNENNKSYIKQLAEKLQTLGARTVVITDGKYGAFALDEQGKFYQQGIISVEVVEKTGAGDGFSTGFLAAMVHGLDIQSAMIWGTINSAGVIGKVGAEAGLLTKKAMEKKASKMTKS